MSFGNDAKLSDKEQATADAIGSLLRRSIPSSSSSPTSNLHEGCIEPLSYSKEAWVGNNSLHLRWLGTTLGFGVEASADIDEDQPCIALPRRLLLTASTAVQDRKVGREITALIDHLKKTTNDEMCSSRVVLHVYLVYQKSLRKSSPWHSYIEVLPCSHVNSDCACGEVLKFTNLLSLPPYLTRLLENTPVARKCAAINEELEKLYYECRSFLKARYPSSVLLGCLSLESFRWAHSCFWSRALLVPRVGEAMVPLVDSMNHKPGIETRFGLSEDGNTVLVYGGTCKSGEQVFINYGAKGNGELLLYYGFVLAENPADVYNINLQELSLWRSHDSAMLEKIFDWMKKEHGSILHNLYKAPTPEGFSLTPGLLNSCRLIALPAAKLENILDSKSLSSLFVPLTTVYGEKACEAQAQPFDWSFLNDFRVPGYGSLPKVSAGEDFNQSVDWALIGDCFGPANELKALDSLSQLLQACFAPLKKDGQDSKELSGPQSLLDATARANTIIYKKGMREILTGTIHSVENLRQTLLQQHPALQESTPRNKHSLRSDSLPGSKRSKLA